MLKLLVGLRIPKVLTKAKADVRVQSVSAVSQELASLTNSQVIDLLLVGRPHSDLLEGIVAHLQLHRLGMENWVSRYPESHTTNTPSHLTCWFNSNTHAVHLLCV